MVDDEGFQVVKKGKRRKNETVRCKVDIPSTLCNGILPEGEEYNLNEIRGRIEKCRVELSTSEFLRSVKEIFLGSPFARTCHPSNNETSKMQGVQRGPLVDIVCYGIGKIASCPTARYQFGLLLLLKEILQIRGRCFVYEPNFSPDDEALVKEFGCLLIERNEEGKRKVQKPTLFFMLHCGKPLYNSVLWANWGLGLSNVVILGNKFTSYQQRIPSRTLSEEAPYINSDQILPYFEECAIPNSFHLTDIFNDSAIHWFPTELLLKVPNTVWTDSKEPKYSSSDSEIVTKDVQS